MPLITRLTDLTTGHGCWPARPPIEASPDFFVNDIAVVRLGDNYEVHCCVSCHGGVLSTASPDFYINDVAVGRVGDSVSCGDTVAEGSPDFYVN